MEFKQEEYNTGLAFMWRKQQQCNWKEMTKIVKDKNVLILRDKIF